MAVKDNIEVRFARAQAKFKPISKRGRNPYFKSQAHPEGSPYCLYEDIMAECLPHLHAEGLNLRHTSRFDSGMYLVGTAIYGEDGTLPAFEMPIPIEGPQKQSAGITYARRVTASSLLAASTDEDDDGNKASNPQPSTQNHPASYYATPVGTPPPQNPTATPPPPQRPFQPMSDEKKVQKIITEGQIKRLYAIAKQKAWDQNEVKDICKRAFGITSFSALNMRDYDILVKTIETKAYIEALDELNLEDSRVPSVGKPQDFSDMEDIPFG